MLFRNNQESFSCRTKRNQSAHILNNSFHIHKHWLDIKELILALTVSMRPQSTVLCLFSGCPIIIQSGLLHPLGVRQPANGNISILFPRASKLCYGKENRPLDLHLDALLIWGSQELRGWTSVLMVSGPRSHF